MSRLTREDFYEMRRCNERPGVPISVKEMERLQIEQQVSAFLSSGGTIDRLCNMVRQKPQEGLASLASKKEEKMFKGTLGITQAARYKGISRRYLAKCITHGMGPKHYTIDNLLRFNRAELDAWTVPK